MKIKTANQARYQFRQLKKNVRIAFIAADCNVDTQDIEDMRLAVQSIQDILRTSNDRFNALRDYFLRKSMAYKKTCSTG